LNTALLRVVIDLLVVMYPRDSALLVSWLSERPSDTEFLDLLYPDFKKQNAPCQPRVGRASGGVCATGHI